MLSLCRAYLNECGSESERGAEKKKRRFLFWCVREEQVFFLFFFFFVSRSAPFDPPLFSALLRLSLSLQLPDSLNPAAPTQPNRIKKKSNNKNRELHTKKKVIAFALPLSVSLSCAQREVSSFALEVWSPVFLFSLPSLSLSFSFTNETRKSNAENGGAKESRERRRKDSL